MTKSKHIYLERLDEFPSYKGGHTCLYGGYVWEFCPGHRLQNHWGWVAQHRLVAEDKLGRPLRQGRDAKIAEHVHHIDGCPTNNDPANLAVLTKSEHHRYESRKYVLSINTHITDESVTDALKGRTIKEAAAALGVCHQTLRNRTPEALQHRMRISPIDLQDAGNAEILRKLAAMPTVSILMAAVVMRTGERTIGKMLKMHQIVWVTPSKKGMVFPTRNGKPTPGALKLRALGIDPASKLRDRQNLELSPELLDLGARVKRVERLEHPRVYRPNPQPGYSVLDDSSHQPSG